MSGLTGNTRLRVQTLPFCKPRVVLQVETAHWHHGIAGSKEVRQWRDAQPEDLVLGEVRAETKTSPHPQKPVARFAEDHQRVYGGYQPESNNGAPVLWPPIKP